MPDKPSRLSREIQLGQQTVTMHMTATQIDGIKFAVGAIKMPDAVKAQAAMALIKSALLKNIEGTISQEKISAANVSGKLSLSEEFNAFNPRTSIRMSGRIVARDGWVFEVLVVGPEHAIDRDIVDMFFSSFKPGNLSDLGSAAAKTPERSIFHRLFGQYLDIDTANPAKSVLVKLFFRYRRPKSDRLLASLDNKRSLQLRQVN